MQDLPGYKHLSQKEFNHAALRVCVALVPVNKDPTVSVSLYLTVCIQNLLDIFV